MPRLLEDPLATPPFVLSSRPQSENLTGNWRSLVPRIDYARCTRCMICWKFCPEACVQIVDDTPRIAFDYCKGCGVCAVECPPKCISMPPEPEEEGR